MTKKKEEKETILRKQATEMLNVILTQEERDERAKVAAKLQGDVNSQEAELKGINETAKAKIKKTKAMMNTAANAHNSGKEMLKVKAEQVFDLDSKSTWFEYRGTRYDERRMYEHEVSEAQKNLFGKRPIEDASGEFEREAKALAECGRFVTRPKWNKWTSAERVEAQKWCAKVRIAETAKAEGKKVSVAKVPLVVESLPTSEQKPRTSEQLAGDGAFMKVGGFLHTAGKEITREIWDKWTVEEREQAVLWSGGNDKTKIGVHATMPPCVALLADVVEKLPAHLAAGGKVSKKPKLAPAPEPEAVKSPTDHVDARAEAGYTK